MLKRENRGENKRRNIFLEVKSLKFAGREVLLRGRRGVTSLSLSSSSCKSKNSSAYVPVCDRSAHVWNFSFFLLLPISATCAVYIMYVRMQKCTKDPAGAQVDMQTYS